MALSYVYYKYQNYFEIIVIYCVQKITRNTKFTPSEL